MRRKDRQITDKQDLIEIMEKCSICRLGLIDDDGLPYILPLNFGLNQDEGVITLYFHSALEGHKIDLIRKDNRASFEMDTSHDMEYIKEKGYCTYYYESIMGRGTLYFLDDDEKEKALEALMQHYHGGKEVYFNKAAMPRTAVYCLKITEMIGKRKLADLK